MSFKTQARSRSMFHCPKTKTTKTLEKLSSVAQKNWSLTCSKRSVRDASFPVWSYVLMRVQLYASHLSLPDRTPTTSFSANHSVRVQVVEVHQGWQNNRKRERLTWSSVHHLKSSLRTRTVSSISVDLVMNAWAGVSSSTSNKTRSIKLTSPMFFKKVTNRIKMEKMLESQMPRSRIR